MYNSDFLEAILEKAITKSHFDRLAAMPSEEELAKIYTLSPEHNKRMKKIFAADKRRQIMITALRYGKAAAFAICISISLMFGAILVSADIRNLVGEAIITWFDKYTKFQTDEIYTENEFVEREWSPRYLPNGFDLSDSREVGSIKSIKYTNSNNLTIRFNYMPDTGSISVDNEDKIYSTIIENGVTYHVFETYDEGENHIIIWDMGGYRFEITGVVDVDELVKVALSVE